MKEKLKKMLNEKRFVHSVGVSETAVEMAKFYGADTEKARIAGLLHDCAKNFSVEDTFKMCEQFGIVPDEIETANPALIHAPLGAAAAREFFGITDEEILRAIRLHTVGGKNMTVLDKIIYLADMVEPSRVYDGVENLRKLIYSGLDNVFLHALDRSIVFNVEKGVLIHTATLDARNEIILNRKK